MTCACTNKQTITLWWWIGLVTRVFSTFRCLSLQSIVYSVMKVFLFNWELVKKLPCRPKRCLGRHASSRRQVYCISKTPLDSRIVLRVNVWKAKYLGYSAWYDSDVQKRGVGVSSKRTNLDRGVVQKISVWLMNDPQGHCPFLKTPVHGHPDHIACKCPKCKIFCNPEVRGWENYRTPKGNFFCVSWRPDWSTLPCPHRALTPLFPDFFDGWPLNEILT